mgnify:CR=1 FL=1
MFRRSNPKSPRESLITFKKLPQNLDTFLYSEASLTEMTLKIMDMNNVMMKKKSKNTLISAITCKIIVTM